MTDVTPSAGSASSANPLSALTRKIGPLPGWAWVAVAVAGYAVWKLYKNRSGTVTNSAADSTNGADTANVPSGDASPVGGGLGAGSVDPGTSVTNTTPVGPVTNGQWASNAARLLIAADPADASTINNALEKYVNQDKAGLNPSERSVVQKAITQLGPPPEGLLSIISAPSSSSGSSHKPTPKPEPPKYRSYTTKRGDTFQSLSIKFYGQKGGGDDIARANPNLSGYGATAKLPVNRVIKIPLHASDSLSIK